MFLFLFPSLPSHIFKIRHFMHARRESRTRALHRQCGSSSASIMHHRWWFLCELSLEFYIWPSNPLFPGWVMTAAISLPLSLCLPPGFSAHRSVNLTTTSLEDKTPLAEEYCANFCTAKKTKKTPKKNTIVSFSYLFNVSIGLCNLSVASWKRCVLQVCLCLWMTLMKL